MANESKAKGSRTFLFVMVARGPCATTPAHSGRAFVQVAFACIGGMLFGLSRRAATEFSFFLAVPTLIAAGLYDLYKNRALLSTDDLGLFGIGTVTAFVSAFACIRWLMRYVASHDFRPFAWYRIGFGLFILISSWAGWVRW
jgi:undecaprenyl-diphosphatase